MYEDIVDYDDFSERVGSENDILDLFTMKFGREHIALNAKDSTPTAEANTLQKIFFVIIAVYNGLSCKRQYFSRHASI